MKSCTPLVSVVIPTYNCASYIGGAIESVFAQSYKHVEVIVVDDCSTDDTQSEIAKFGKNVVCTRNEVNRGVSFSRNGGIEQSKGEFVAFLDADDAWLPHKLEGQVEVLSHDASLVAVGGRMVPFHDAAVHDKCLDISRFTQTDLFLKNWLATPTVMARRECLAKCGGFDCSLTICEDYDLWLRIAGIGSVAVLDDVLARYRVRPDGASSGNRERSKRLHIEYLRSIPTRFSTVPGIKKLSRINLAMFYLEVSIAALDREHSCVGSLYALLQSAREWPLSLPVASRRIRFKRTLQTIRRMAFGFPT